MFEAFMYAVGDGTVVVQRSKYMVHSCFDVFQAVDIQEGFLLTCKRCIRQVFGSCRRTDGNGNIRAACVCNHFVPCCLDFSIQLFGEGRIQNPLADFFTDARQFGDIFHIQLCQCGGNTLAQSVVRQECAVGFGGSGKTAGDADAFFSQLTDHFTQGGVFAAHAFNISHTQVFKPNYVVVSHLCVQSKIC